MRNPAHYGPYALVAGASEGLGAAFASRLAALGLDLVLVARRAGPLGEVAERIRAATGRRVLPVAADLGEASGLDDVLRAARDLEIGLLVCNAAHAPLGAFLDRPVDEHLAAIAVNVTAPLVLAHAFGGRMAARGRGGIVVVTSLAGFQGTPLVASYAATKAFDTVLAEGLWDELRARGVDVLACCAGATDTPGYARSAPSGRPPRLAPRLQPADGVASEALGALGRAPLVITGAGNRIASLVMRRVLTRERAVRIMGREMRRRYSL